MRRAVLPMTVPSTAVLSMAVLPVLLLVLVGLPALPAAADGGPWGWPLPGPREVSRGFDPPATRYGAGHRGVDLAAVPGLPVRASAAGRVTYAGMLAGRGVVVVTHGALRTTYEPVTPSVRVGQAVALGEGVGKVAAGHLGCPAAACLHWGLRRGEEYLDPVRLVEPGPVRLLPLDQSGAGQHGQLPATSQHPPAPDAAGTGAAGSGSASTGSGPADAEPGAPAPVPPIVDEPRWSLRAAEAPLGAAAVVALVVGIGLLARPRPPPPAPVSGGVPRPAGTTAEEPDRPSGALLDLDAARAQRRAAS